MSKSNRVYALVPNTPTQSTAKSPPPVWQTGLCDCAGQNECCLECCCVVMGLDFCLCKEMDEQYQERGRGLQYSRSTTFQPDPGTCEAWCGHGLWRIMGFALTYPLAPVWCFCLAYQRSQVREMYHLSGNFCEDLCIACCCRCCMFNQLKHQLMVDNPDKESITPEQVNTMRAENEKYRNKTWTVSNRTFRNPPNGPVPGQPTREYV